MAVIHIANWRIASLTLITSDKSEGENKSPHQHQRQ